MTQREKLLKEWQDIQAIWTHYRSGNYNAERFTKRQRGNHYRKLMHIHLRLIKIQSLILSLPIEDTPTPK
jgi:hypothetical protein